ncbi:MAG TPA: SDR family NAD(P)-dependent oxidoreductase, partial [Acidimicrobiales bacterium]|nr:SDR family NAD(P)-dependent oxidoreductase [Acidimicrobiales bacterium]
MLSGRVVVVTGAGRGIGRAHALALAGQGAYVVVNDLGVAADGTAPSSSPADDVVAEVRAAGGEAVASHDDVVAGAERIVTTAIDAYGRLDAVVNNAGILRSGLLLRTTPDDWRAVFDVHLVGTLAVTQAAAVYWRNESKAGRPPDACVVNTTSSAGLLGFTGEPAYSAAKAGVIGFTLTAAAELERYGVRVNAIAPEAATRLTAWAGEQPEMAPALISPLVVWLCGPASAGVTGRVFEVGGGVVHVLEGWRRAVSVDHDAETPPRILGERVAFALGAVAPPTPA